MPEFEGYKIIYEVIGLPKGKWSIVVEIIQRQDGEVLAPRHNPFPSHPFDTKLEALDQVNQYIEAVLAETGSEGKLRRIA
ncbi:hypothetical protein CupriaWKF_11540 [Cupriavidus sp. WKF15]|uniref:hypothetical protein n=1 Tax=Cupriavidus sp. WKF15 TaxID=3032282 RepID=UPI0023E11144|nr:hypothetical protein [Cupriavidus sp. WKF15]WER44954.1 hypothetical protein CupriaWKF_11540 [Cupriavidus sp. WKF15]